MEVELLEKIAKNTEHKTRQVLIQDLTQRLSWVGIKYTK